MLQELVTYLTITSAVIGAFWGLFQYTKSQKLKAAELLLNMETEFRIILPTIELIESKSEYNAFIKPLLEKEKSGKKLKEGELKLLTDIDRVFRFFFLCVVLDKDLAVTTKALRYAYYHYLAILAEHLLPKLPETPSELADYLSKYYPRLCRWLKENKDSLQLLRETGKWKSPGRIIWDRNKQNVKSWLPQLTRKNEDQ